MKDLENKNDLTETEIETVSGGIIIHSPSPDPKPSDGGASGSW